jgi:hypothetical protein
VLYQTFRGYHRLLLKISKPWCLGISLSKNWPRLASLWPLYKSICLRDFLSSPLCKWPPNIIQIRWRGTLSSPGRVQASPQEWRTRIRNSRGKLELQFYYSSKLFRVQVLLLPITNSKSLKMGLLGDWLSSHQGILAKTVAVAQTIWWQVNNNSK